MFNADLMQFKDEMLKNLREMEKKIMIKVSKNQTDISTDINIINDSIKLLRENNNSLIESMAEQKVNIDKISDFEKTLKKINSTISGHENKISDSLSELSYIRNRCENSVTETLSVPGIIGKNCKFSNFNEYIMFNMKEISALKTEKDYNRKENIELRTKLDQGIKNLSNLVDTFINRSKLYTDSTKKMILELLDGKIKDIEGKNMEFISKFIDTEQKIKDFGDNMEDFNKKKNEQFQKMEDSLLLINYNIEEMSKKLNTAKEELDLLKNNEEQYKNDITELKNIFNKIFNNNINSQNNYNQNFYTNRYNPININNNTQETNYLFPYPSSSKMLSLNKGIDINNFNEFNKRIGGTYSPNTKMPKNSKISLLLGDSNSNSVKNNNVINQINNNSTFNNFYINNQKRKNTEFNLKNINEDNLAQSEQMSETNEREEKIKDNINKNIELINRPSNYTNLVKNFKARSKKKNSTIDPNYLFNKNKNIFSFDTNTNTILEEKVNANIEYKKSEYHLHKTSKGKTSNNNITTTNKLKKDINIKEVKEEKTINNKESTNKIKEQESILTNKKVNKGTDVISINTNNIKKKSHNSFPLIKKNRKLGFSQEFLNYKNTNNHMNFNNNLLFNKNEKIKNNNDFKNNQFDVDKETGTGYKVVKLSFDETMTPYNTNGLLTIASKKYLNKHLIFADDSTPYDDIYLLKNSKANDMYHTCRNSNSYPKNNANYNRTAQIFFKNISLGTKNKNEKIKVNLASKTISQFDAFQYGKVKFHLIKKNKLK